MLNISRLNLHWSNMGHSDAKKLVTIPVKYENNSEHESDIYLDPYEVEGEFVERLTNENMDHI